MHQEIEFNRCEVIFQGVIASEGWNWMALALEGDKFVGISIMSHSFAWNSIFADDYTLHFVGTL